MNVTPPSSDPMETLLKILELSDAGGAQTDEDIFVGLGDENAPGRGFLAARCWRSRWSPLPAPWAVNTWSTPCTAISCARATPPHR